MKRFKTIRHGALISAAFGIVTPALADLAGDQPVNVFNNNQTELMAANNWPNSAAYGTAPVIDSGTGGQQGSPNSTYTNGSNDTETVLAGKVEAETFTPATNFNLGAFSVIIAGAPDTNSGNNVTVSLFQLSQGNNGASTGYQLSQAEVGNNLLGNGNGLSYHYYGSNVAILEFDFTNGPNSDDQVPLQAGVTYAFEIWDVNTAGDFFMPRTPAGVQTYAGGQVYSDSSGEGEEAFSTEVRGQVTGSGASNLMFAVYAAPASAVASSWTANTGGSWNSASNWSNSAIPHNTGDAATFGTSVAGNSTVTLDGAQTVSTLNFNTGSSYTIAAGTGGTLTLGSNGSAGAQLNDLFGNHFISAPVILASNTTIAIGQNNDTFTFSGNISGTGGLTLGGTSSALAVGTVSLSGSNTYTGPTTVNGGELVIAGHGALPSGNAVTLGASGTAVTLQLAKGIGATTVSSLTISNGSTVDITNNTLTIAYGNGTDPASTIRTELISGFNATGSKWAGTGITSSLAAANPTGFAVGYADGGNPADVANTGVQPGNVEIKYTVAGDANLSGAVDLSDLVIIASDFGMSGADWAQGDVNYDGNVDLSDLVIVASNFGSSVIGAEFSGSFAADWQLALAEAHSADVSVPEPCGLLGLGLLGYLTQRRRQADNSCPTGRQKLA